LDVLYLMKSIYLLNEKNFLCFILDLDVAIKVYNQTGGELCNFSSMVGVPIMLSNTLFQPSLKDQDLFLSNISIKDWLEYNLLDMYFEEDVLSVLSPTEAWIPLKIKNNCDLNELFLFRGMSGVLTYQNSD